MLKFFACHNLNLCVEQPQLSYRSIADKMVLQGAGEVILGVLGAISDMSWQGEDHARIPLSFVGASDQMRLAFLACVLKFPQSL